MEKHEPDWSCRIARQRDIERLSDTELRRQYEQLIADIAANAGRLRDELHLIGAELSRREYQVFRRAALARHA